MFAFVYCPTEQCQTKRFCEKVDEELCCTFCGQAVKQPESSAAVLSTDGEAD